MTRPQPEPLVARVRGSHLRERDLIDGLTDDDLRAPSALPGWTRGHVLAARLAFVRAVERQIAYALSGQQIDFYDGGEYSQEAIILADADRPADDLVLEVHQATRALDHSWSELAVDDFKREVFFRDGGTLFDILRVSWQDVELRQVDLNLGVRPSAWDPELCSQLFELLADRIPAGFRVELNTPEGRQWVLGQGSLVRITGDLTDLAAWLAGRHPRGPLNSSLGVLPDLARHRGF